MGKSVVNSPLVKTAIAGNDPNVGRIAGAVGSWVGREGKEVDFGMCNMAMGGESIFRNGKFDLSGEKEVKLSRYIEDASYDPRGGEPEHEREVEIVIDFQVGEGNGRVWGSDLTKEYVEVNADYRS